MYKKIIKYWKSRNNMAFLHNNFEIRDFFHKMYR